MIRRRSLVASLAATLVAGLLAMIPGTPAVSAAPNDKSPRLVEQTETSDVYANGDGTYKAVFYAGPVNFFDKATNQWRKLDKQFRQVGDHIENGAGPARVQLPTQMSAAHEVIVAKDDWSLSFAFTDATSTRPAKIVKGHVRYDDVAPGVSLDYRMLSNGLKEDIVLDQPRPAGSPATFRFRLSAQGITPVGVDGGTAVALQDAKGQEVARIPRGTMVDARGLKGVVDMHLTNQNGAWSVDVAPDAAFLQGAAYPVRIDPAVIYTPLSPTDAFVDSICTTCNYGGLDFLKAGWVGNAQYFAYVRFPDLTRILGKGVTNAELRLQSSYEDDPSRFGLTALRTHGSWNASSITWANMANHGPERYDVDRNQQLGPAYYFPITSWAQGWSQYQDGDWINGKWSPRGATINTAGDNAFYQLGAAESTFVPEIPSMSVTYTNQTPNVITTRSPDDNWVGTASPALSAVFSDPDDTNGWIEYSVDGVLRGQFTTINGSTAPNFGLGAGQHTWQVRGVDADSYGPWSAVRYLTINTAPSVPDQLSPADGYYNTTLPALSARFLDNSANGTLRFEVNGVTYSVGGIANGATGSCTTTNLCLPSSLAPGLYSWRVQAVDAFGLASNWSPYQQFEYRYAGQVMREEYPLNGSQWDTTKWATSSGLTVANNQGVFPAVTASKRATATVAGLQDSEVAFTYSIPDRTAGTELRITLRGYGATGSAQLPYGYRLDIPSNSNTMSLKKIVNSTVSTLGSFTYAGSPLDASQVRVRFRVEGSTVSAKLWPAGTLEPTAWSLQKPDSQITAAGTLQISQSYQTPGSGRTIYVDNITYQNLSYWGLDSSDGISQDRYNDAKSTYGKPSYWGRYLHDDENPNPGDHKGVNREIQNEVSVLSANQIPIWVIDYNPKERDLQTYDKGKHAAERAICHAGPPGPAPQQCPDGLNIPKTVAIFADVEPNEVNKPLIVDSDWIWGWFNTINSAGWKVGFYGNPRTDNNFIAPFCQAVGLHPEMQTKSYMWSQQPLYGRTREANAPPYKPIDFSCPGKPTIPSLGWQYGIQSSSPGVPPDNDIPTPGTVDMDLIKPSMWDVLWFPGGTSCPAFRGATCPQ